MTTRKPNILQRFKFEFRITLNYLIFGLLWILFSDKLLDLIQQDDSLLTEFQTYKGAFFIVVTAIFLYLFAKNHMQRLRLAESKLMESECHYKALFNNNHSVILLINPDTGGIEDANPAACRYYGWERAEWCGKTVYDLNAEDRESVAARLNAVKAQTMNHFIGKHRLAGGEVRDVEVFSNKIIVGDKVMIYSNIHDITEQKRMEHEFFESQLNFHRSISESPVGIRIVSVEGKTIYVNKSFLDIFDFENLEEFTNTPAIKRYTAESYAQHQIRKEQRKKGTEPPAYEISIVCKSGKIRHVKVSRKEILWNGIKHFQVINIDITEQRNAEDELRKLSKAIEQSPVSICISNVEGIIEYVNPELINLTGYSVEDLVNENLDVFSRGTKTKQKHEQLWQAVKSGVVWSGEFQNRKKNGDYYWESATISPIYDTAGQITHFLTIKEDITNRKLSEIALNESEELLRKFASHLQNVREEEKVALAREIHDDLGQNLVALKIDTGLLKNKTIELNKSNHPEETSERFDRIIGLIDRTIKTARRIMNGLRPEQLEINGFIATATSYLEEFEERYRVNCEFISGMESIQLTSQQSLALFRIFQESLNNIAKHSKATVVTVILKTESDRLVMEMIDNGIGFDIQNSGRKDSYGMIGMKERIVLLGGELNISSEVGKGTSVRVIIPWSSGKL